MGIRTRKQIRDHVSSLARETQIDDLINDYINLTLQEVNDPGWAYELIGQRGYHHNWSFNRRKTTVSATAETAQLPRDCDKIVLVRQVDSPTKLTYVPDEIFYKFIPYPTATGNPRFYRMFEEEGVSTRLTAADTIDVVSSSTADSSTFEVVVSGYVGGYRDTEVYTLNGTTTVSGTKTWDANRPLRVSKSANTTGKITVTENSGGTTLVVLGPQDTSPRFKVIELYPIPSSTTLYIEYYTRIKLLYNDSDSPDLDEKWSSTLVLGTFAKVLQYQNKITQYSGIQQQYAAALRGMVKSDIQMVDYIPMLESHGGGLRTSMVKLSDTTTAPNYGAGYGLFF